MKQMLVGNSLFFVVLVLPLMCKVIASEEIPHELISQIFTQGAATTIGATGGCPDSPSQGKCRELKESDIKLQLYKRKSANTPITLNPTNPIEVDPSKKIIFMIHGWTASVTSYGFPQLKNAYLKRYDCNLIGVDWSKLGQQLYPLSVCFLPKVAQFMAEFLCRLNNQLKIPLNTVHLVGHSLGGQMSGLIGQRTVLMCGQNVGRITAMDPAGPCFEGLPVTERLDKNDAVFVDVIHTNDGVLGYTEPCGHVDFYVNCGRNQPGCPELDAGFTVENPIEASSCDHYRSVYYMTESVNSLNFKAKPCKACPDTCKPDDANATEVIMGENCSTNSPPGLYVLKTNAEPPFALG